MRKSGKTMRILKKNLLIMIAILIIVCGGLYVLLFVRKDDSQKTNVVEEISKYGYTLDDRDTVYMISVFNELKTELNSKEVNYEKYAELLSKLYVIDLYTINNKTSKYDVGSFEYVHPDGVDNFKLQVGDTLYKYLGTLNKDEKPEVINTTVSNIETDKYEYKDKSYDAYKLHITWEYKTDLEYDTEANVILMKDNNKLYVVEFNPEVK